MTNRRFAKLFGKPPRRPESDLKQHHIDLAACIQAVTEDQGGCLEAKMCRCIY